MPTQVVGVIEASPALLEAEWLALVEPPCRWRFTPVEEIDADFEQLQADLAEEWARFQTRLCTLR